MVKSQYSVVGFNCILSLIFRIHKELFTLYNFSGQDYTVTHEVAWLEDFNTKWILNKEKRVNIYRYNTCLFHQYLTYLNQ